VADNQVFDRFAQVLAELFDLQLERITPDVTFSELKIDDVDVIVACIALEIAFDIAIPQEQLEGTVLPYPFESESANLPAAATLGRLHQIVQGKLNNRLFA
jgi:acyl carrier protein